jgi:hypothetical protein
MNSYEHRQRKLAQIREAAGEAVIAPSVPDDANVLELLNRQLDDEQAALQRLVDDDPVGFVAFGQDDDTWLDKRLGRDAPK